MNTVSNSSGSYLGVYLFLCIVLLGNIKILIIIQQVFAWIGRT